MIISNKLEQWNTMYPSSGYMVEKGEFTLPDFCKHCSIYGYSYGYTQLTIDGKSQNLEAGQYFAFSVNHEMSATVTDKLFLVVRLGYRVPNQVGWIETKGRLSYIDGCSDSLLVFPARLGDSSLNLLYFPEGINQSFHTHPSLRLGCVVSGAGFAQHGKKGKEEEVALLPGVSFCLQEQEHHRFRTTDSSMTVIAFHPDGDWGPTDHNHSMINRTYLSDK